MCVCVFFVCTWSFLGVHVFLLEGSLDSGSEIISTLKIELFTHMASPRLQNWGGGGGGGGGGEIQLKF